MGVRADLDFMENLAVPGFDPRIDYTIPATRKYTVYIYIYTHIYALVIYQESDTYPLNHSNSESKPTNFPTNTEEVDADFEVCARKPSM
jgi:hypothetical protein